MKTLRPRLSLPFTIIVEQNTVRLIAGEDSRYTLTASGLDAWLPALLADCSGKRPLDELVKSIPANQRDQARSIVARLYGERVLVDGIAADAHVATQYRVAVEGGGPLADALRADAAGHAQDARVLTVLCQDRLDYAEALEFNRRGRAGTGSWMWVTTGPMTRGYVSPPFLPDAGPCLACLLRHFQRLSPTPELHDAIVEHHRRGGAIAAVSFAPEGVEMLRQLTHWKFAQLASPDPPAALYRLHVLELDTMQVTAHRVFIDPQCPECGDG